MISIGDKVSVESKLMKKLNKTITGVVLNIKDNVAVIDHNNMQVHVAMLKKID